MFCTAGDTQPGSMTDANGIPTVTKKSTKARKPLKRKASKTPAGGKPAKRQRTSRKAEQVTATQAEAERDMTSDDEEVGLELRRSVLLGKKNTQIKSKARSVIPAGAKLRDTICLKCALEISQFPGLKCCINPASDLDKCYDCSRKGRDCEDVSNNPCWRISN
jgi:hypothetical protein